MSYDPSPSSAPSRPIGVHLAIALLSLAFAIFLAAQVGNAAQQKKALNWQLTNGEKQIETAKENEKQLTELIKQQDTLVAQSNALQAQYQKLFDDVLKLAEDDADAKQVVQKWKIARPTPPADKPAEKPADKK